MKLIRVLVQTHSKWFGMLFMIALAMKALTPNGYMVSADSQTITIKICNGLGDAEQTIDIQMNTNTNDHDSGSNMNSEACSSSSVSQSTMMTIDPVQLALALGFIMLAGLVVKAAILFARLPRLRPPLRGPPASV